MKRLFIVAIALFASFAANAQSAQSDMQGFTPSESVADSRRTVLPDHQTYTYAIKGSDTLRLDLYRAADCGQPSPLVIFLFGGGFFTGNRDALHYGNYFATLPANGWSVASIDYRLGLRDLGKDGKKITPVGMLNTFRAAVDTAVVDLFSATAFLLENAPELNIDPKTIVVSGSSAGAITSIQGEWNIANHSDMTEQLPAEFNYAGVISFAGAVLSFSGKPDWSSNPCPVMMFHGSADSNVPYDRIRMFNVGFFGSKYLCEQFADRNTPYWFYDVADTDHSLASTPMTDKLDEILLFLKEMVVDRQPLEIHTTVTTIGTPRAKRHFKLTDYIKSNFKQ